MAIIIDDSGNTLFVGSVTSGNKAAIKGISVPYRTHPTQTPVTNSDGDHHHER
jgi:hypothetical protein